MAVPSVRKFIDTIRERISSSPDQKASDGHGLYFIVLGLGARWEELVKEPCLMAEVLELAEEISEFRGKGNRNAARGMSQLFSFIGMQLVESLPEYDATFTSFAKARKALPTASVTLDALEKFTARALACLQGPPSRSQHTCRLRAEAWSQLGRICEVVSDLTILDLALKIATNPKLPDEERESAVNFLPEFWGDDEPDEATTNALTSLENEPPNRDFLISVLQAQIQLGLNNNLGAMAATDHWEDVNEEDEKDEEGEEG